MKGNKQMNAALVDMLQNRTGYEKLVITNEKQKRGEKGNKLVNEAETQPMKEVCDMSLNKNLLESGPR
jgi:hypothetical protein